MYPMYTPRNLVVVSLGAVLIACGLPAQAQPTLEWTRVLGTSEGDEGFAAAADGLGNVYVGGLTNGNLPRSTGHGGGFLAKYDANGTPLWIRQPDGWERVLGASVDHFGNVYIAGDGDSSDAVLSKFNANGSLLWTQRMDSSGNDIPLGGVTTDAFGNVYLAGETTGDLGGSNAGEEDAFVAKYDEKGVLQWTRQFGSNVFDEASGLATDEAGNVFVAGRTRGNLGGPTAGDIDGFVAKFDTNGAAQWIKQFGTSLRESASAIHADGLGNVFVGGSTTGNLWGGNSGGLDSYLVNFDSNGTVQWSRQFGSTGFDAVEDVTSDGLGNIYVSGDAWGAHDEELFVSKFSIHGAHQWTRQFGFSPDYDTVWGYGVVADGLDNVFVVGTLLQAADWSTDILIAKFVDRQSIPEPASVCLVSLATLALLGLRRLALGKSEIPAR